MLYRGSAPTERINVKGINLDVSEYTDIIETDEVLIN
jgi:hypothetical protein